MPRRLDPADISVGTGRAQAKSVDASAFTHPAQGTDGLAAHIADPHQAHMAETIGLVDAGGFFVSDEVEGALQEIGGGVSHSRQSGWYSAGVTDFDTAVGDAGLTLTLAGSWIAILGASPVDVSGDSIALPNNVSRWVYVTPSGVLAASVGTPDITTTENVIVGLFTTAGGAVTVKTDGRFFVRNDNRKIDFSVRSSGVAADANSEACFMTLAAALLWVDTFNASGVARKTHITIRGAHTISSTVTLATPNIVFAGEDGAEFITGAALSPMFDLNGQDQVEFRNITFTCAHAASTAIADNAATLNDFLIDRCVFSGGTEWDVAVDLTGASTSRAVIRDSNILATERGVFIGLGSNCMLEHVRIASLVGGGAGPAITLGDPLGTPSQSGLHKVQGCVLGGYPTGVYVHARACRVQESYIEQCSTAAIHVDVGSQDTVISGNTLDGGGTDLCGIQVEGAFAALSDTRQVNITQNTIRQYVSEGIWVSGYVLESSITGNQIDNFIDGVTDPSAPGIVLESLGGDDLPSDIVITSNTIRRSTQGIVLQGAPDVRSTGTITVVNAGNVTPGDTVTIGGVVLTAVAGVPAANQFDISSGTVNGIAAALRDAINLPSNGIFDFRAHATVAAAILTIYAASAGPSGTAITLASSDVTGITVSGANLTGGSYGNIMDVNVSNNDIFNCGVSQTGVPAPQTVAGMGSAGITLYFAQRCVVNSNNIHDLGVLQNNSAVAYLPSSVGPDVYSTGIVLWNSQAITCIGNTVSNLVSEGIGFAQGILVVLQNTSIEPTFTFLTQDMIINDNVMSWTRYGDLLAVGSLPGMMGIGLLVEDAYEDALSGVAARGLAFDGNTIRGTTDAALLGLATGGAASITNMAFRGNKVAPFQGGGLALFSSDTDITDITVTDNVMKSEDILNGTPAPYMEFGGIYLYTQPASTTANIQRVHISNNTIYASQSAIHITASGDGSDITISGNDVRMAGAGAGPSYARPVRMNLGTDGVKGTLSGNVTLTGNIFEGGDGVRLSCLSGQIVENVLVQGNVFAGTSNDTDPTPANPDGFYAAFSIHVEEPAAPVPPVAAGDILRNVVISGNSFTNTQREAIAVTKTDTQNARNVHDIHITDNTLFSCGEASPVTLDLTAVVLVTVISTTSTDLLYAINIQDNTFHDIAVHNNADSVLNVASVIGINAATTTASSMHITGNTFRDCTADSDNADIATAAMVTAVTLLGFTTVDLSRNTYFTCSTDADSTGANAIAAIHFLYSFIGMFGLNQDQNQAVLCNVTSNSTIANALSGTFVSNTTGGTDNVHASGNQVGAGTMTATGAGDTFACLALMFANNVSSVCMSDNHFRDTDLVAGVNGAHAILLQADTTAGRARDIIVSNNTLANITNAANPAQGIAVRTHDATNILISGNVLRNDPQEARGIVVESLTTGTSLRIQVQQNTTSGFEEGVAITGENISDVVVSGNTLDVTAGITRRGVRVSGADLQNIVCATNTITCSGEGIRVVAGDAIQGVNISNNTMQGALTNAIGVTVADGNLIEVGVHGNDINSGCTNGIQVLVTIPTANRQIRNIACTGNTIRLPTDTGLTVEGTTNGLSVVSILGVTMANNIVNIDAAAAAGIVVDNGGDASIVALVCTGNSIRMASNASEGFYVDGAATSRHLVFQGNTVTDIDAAGTAITGMAGLALDRVILLGNTSNGSAATWNAWYVALGAITNSPAPADVALWNWL